MPDNPNQHSNFSSIYGVYQFTPQQLKWLQDKQIWIDQCLEDIEPADSVQADGNVEDTTSWEGYVILQGKVNADARDLKIPESATPNVKALWNARRTRLGRGMYFHTIMIFGFVLLTRCCGFIRTCSSL